jgi:predicted metal-dependent hydrolase
MKYEELYISYLIYFNRDQDYFECHEVLEELWLHKNRDPLYKGLLQVAVGLYHFRNHNIIGGLKMMHSAANQLEQYPAILLGIELGVLVSQVRHYAKQLERFKENPFPYYDLSIIIVDPTLQQMVNVATETIIPNIPQQRGPKRPQRKKTHVTE